MLAFDFADNAGNAALFDRMRAQIKSGPGSAINTVIPGPDRHRRTAMSKRTCSIDGCEKPHYAHDWCEMHYARWRRNGVPQDTPLSRGSSGAPKVCAIVGCDNPSRARGWCEMHRRRWMHHGDPSNPGKYEVIRDPAEALRKRSKKEGSCIIWTGTIEPGGYGQIRVEGKIYGAHRYAWIATNGPIPEGMVIDHVCHNPACINTEHLRLATYSQNGAHRGRRQANNTSGYRGVSWKPRSRIYVAEVIVNGERISKHFPADQKEAAAEWVRSRRREIFGEFAGWQE